MEPAQPQTAPQANQSEPRNRTIAADIARLIKANKLSQADLKALDKDLRAEAISYASTLEDEPETAPLSIRRHALITDSAGPIPSNLKIRQTPAHIDATPIQKPEIKIPIPHEIKPTPKIETPPEPKPIPSQQPAPAIKKEESEAKPKPVPPEQTPPSYIKSNPSPTPAPSQSQEETFQSTLRDLSSKRAAIESDMQGLMSEKNDLLHTLESIMSEEREVEEEERRIRRELQESIPSAQKKTLEEERWSFEDKRQAFEKTRWETRKQEEALAEKILTKRKELTDISSKEKEVNDSIRSLNLKKEAEAARKELSSHEEEHRKILDKKRKYESDWSSLNGMIVTLKSRIESRKRSEQEANRQFEEIERKELATSDEKERHKLEEERWRADKALRDNERDLWNTEDELNKKLEEQKDLEQTFASIQIEEEDILDKIQNSKAVIHRAEKVNL